MLMRTITTKIIAHRGASGLVKVGNTLEAFQKAIEVKADGIELDLRKTKDNIICVHHDPNIQDLIIKDHTYEECNIAASNLGYHVPTLQETLELCCGKILLDIEIKETGYEDEIINMVLKYYNENEFYIRSFIYDAILNVKKVNPNIFTFLLVGEKFKPIKELLSEIFPSKLLIKTKADGISPIRKYLMFGYISRMKRQKTPISVWTVNNHKLMKKLLKKNVDYIITDYPNIGITLREQLNNRNQ